MEVAVQILSPLTMANNAYVTPPNPCKRTYQTPPADAGLSVDKLMRMLEAGILSKEDVRQKIMEWAPPPPPLVSPPPTAPFVRKKPAAKPTKRGRENNYNDNDQNVLPPVKKVKKRPGKPGVTDATLRRICRNPTRRRFFRQCCDPKSLLWTTNPSGDETVNISLRDAAAADPIELIYNDNPGTTRSVERNTILRKIKWQIKKDRANYKGKQPVRQVWHGGQLEFDWAGTLTSINLAKQKARFNKKSDPQLQLLPAAPTHPPKQQLQRQLLPAPTQPPKQQLPATQPPQQQLPATQSPQQQLSATQPPQQQLPTTQPPQQQLPATQPPPQQQLPKQLPAAPTQAPTKPKNGIDVDNLKQCCTCTLPVWIGPEAEKPGDIRLAFPRETDWTNPNAEAHCKSCWDVESEMLMSLGGAFKAMGAKLNKDKPKNKNKTKDPQARRKITKRVKKKHNRSKTNVTKSKASKRKKVVKLQKRKKKVWEACQAGTHLLKVQLTLHHHHVLGVSVSQ